MEANNGKEGSMVGWTKIIVKKAEAKKVKMVAWLDGSNNGKEGCMVGWKQIMVKKAAWLDGSK